MVWAASSWPIWSMKSNIGSGNFLLICKGFTLGLENWTCLIHGCDTGLGYKLRRDSGFEFWMNARKYIHVADPSWLEQKTCFQLVIWMHHLAEEFCTSINLTNIYTADSNTYGDVGLDDEVFLLVFTKSSRSKCLNLIFLKNR